MKMEKKKIWKIFCAILICIFLFLIYKLCAGTFTKGSNPFENIKKESEASVIFIIPDFYLGMGEEKKVPLNFQEEILFLKEGKAYYVDDEYNSESHVHSWYLKVFDIENSIGKTCAVLDNGYGFELEDSNGRRGAYFTDTEIILNGEEKVAVYNMDTETVQEFSHEEYKLPEIQVETVDHDKILIRVDGNEKIWTLEDMAWTSESIKKLCTYRDKKVQSGKGLLDEFFELTRVNIIEDKLYLQCKAYNSQGKKIFILLEYDIKQEEWRYVESAYSEHGYFVYKFEYEFQ